VQGETMTTASGRPFHVWGNAMYDANAMVPVVLAFHGWHSNGRDFARWFKMEEHVGGAALTVYPDSKGPKWDFDGNQDLDYVSEIIAALADRFCIDRAHVLALGFSYGARFVHHLGCKRPDLVRAIVAGGGGWNKEAGCRPMPVLVTNRTHDDDQVLSLGTDAAERWARIDGCTDGTEETDELHGCVAYRGCAAGAVTFCEDRHYDAAWPHSWNHTVREEYRSLAWAWFTSL
jgi:polyhydroxybutyrate depolymerase